MLSEARKPDNKIVQERISYYDLAKGFGIILVVLGHIGTFSTRLTEWIYSFHMALFFIISGMLLVNIREQDFPGRIILKKFKSLLLPYLWFSLFYIPIDFFHLIRGNITRQTFVQNQLDSLTGSGITTLWFLPALFISEILTIFIIRLLRKIKFKKELPFCLLLLLITLAGSSVLYFLYLQIEALYAAAAPGFLSATLFNFIKVIFRGCIFTFFPAFGFVIRNVVSKLPRIWALITGILLMVLHFFTSMLNGFVDSHHLTLQNLPLFYTNAILGTLGVILICKGFRRLYPLEYLGKNSLIIMATHLQFFVIYFSFRLIDLVIQFIPAISFPAQIALILLFALLLELPFIEIVNRFLPFILGKRKNRE